MRGRCLSPTAKMPESWCRDDLGHSGSSPNDRAHLTDEQRASAQQTFCGATGLSAGAARRIVKVIPHRGGQDKVTNGSKFG